MSSNRKRLVGPPFPAQGDGRSGTSGPGTPARGWGLLGFRPADPLDPALHRGLRADPPRSRSRRALRAFPSSCWPACCPGWPSRRASRAPASALTDNAAMVKKTVFPVETLVLSVVLAAVVNQVIALRHLRRLRRLAWATSRCPGCCSRVPALAAPDPADVRHRLPRRDGDDASSATRRTVVGIVLTVVFYATPIVYPTVDDSAAHAAARGPARQPRRAPGRVVPGARSPRTSARSAASVSVPDGVRLRRRGARRPRSRPEPGRISPT